ncbi:hypothetical protein F4679DRAFT_593427 [Xylaria curta]|nr:hypothetical protein F4679DRAFT_593427 [Xylaria curta]
MAEQVAYIQELLRLIAQHTKNRRTLYNACLVSHAFYEAFNPYLYQDVRWSYGNVQYLVSKNRCQQRLHENISKHARTLIFSFPGVVSIGNKLNRQISTAIIEICQHSRHLRSIACEGIHPTTQYFGGLSCLPHLENLSIAFPRSPGRLMMKDLSSAWNHLALGNLRKLSLLDLWDYMDNWRRDAILQIILQSPNLEHFSLSLSRTPVYSYSRLFTWIAEQYKFRKGHKLRLKILRLGFCIRVPHNLHELLDLSVLQELSTWDKVPEQLFSGDMTPKLRKILIRESALGCWVSIDLIAAARENPPSIQISPEVIGDDDDLRRCLHISRVAQIILSQRVWESMDESGKARECLSMLAHVTDLGIEMSASDVTDLANTSCQSLKPLVSLKNLWIMGYHDPVPDVTKQAASVLPSLRLIRMKSRSWLIHRDIKSEGDISLEPLDEWEGEAHGPDFFHVPRPHPWGDGLGHEQVDL